MTCLLSMQHTHTPYWPAPIAGICTLQKRRLAEAQPVSIMQENVALVGDVKYHSNHSSHSHISHSQSYNHSHSHSHDSRGHSSYWVANPGSEFMDCEVCCS